MYKKLFIIIGIILILSGCEDKEIINSILKLEKKLKKSSLQKDKSSF